MRVAIFLNPVRIVVPVKDAKVFAITPDGSCQTALEMLAA
jgi:hypothetical protein